MSAFLALRALPAAVLGPRERAPLMRLASARALTGEVTELSLLIGWTPFTGRVATKGYGESGLRREEDGDREGSERIGEIRAIATNHNTTK